MRKIYITAIAAMFFTSLGIAQEYTDGVFILNEGRIGTNSASVSFLNDAGIIENDIFGANNNGAELGDTGQSMGFYGEKAYVVLNYSNEVKVVDRASFVLETAIVDQIEMPRHIAFYNDKAYVTNWGDPTDADDDYIAVIDLNTNVVISKIAVTEGPERILEHNGKLYVAHEGGYSFGNTISVIDLADNSIVSIDVSDVPSSLHIQGDHLYVLGSGKPDWSGEESIAKIFKIALSDYEIITELAFEEEEHPTYMIVDSNDVYYVLETDIFKMSLTATSLPTSAFIETATQGVSIPYGFSKFDDIIYLSDAVDYVSDGKVFVYDQLGAFIEQFTTGYLPNGFYRYSEDMMSVEDVVSATISVYPNPASEKFFLNTQESAMVKIFDVAGRLIKQEGYSNNGISLENIVAGVYLIHVEVGAKSFTQKLIVK